MGDGGPGGVFADAEVCLSERDRGTERRTDPRGQSDRDRGRRPHWQCALWDAYTQACMHIRAQIGPFPKELYLRIRAGLGVPRCSAPEVR